MNIKQSLEHKGMLLSPSPIADDWQRSKCQILKFLTAVINQKLSIWSYLNYSCYDYKGMMQEELTFHTF